MIIIANYWDVSGQIAINSVIFLHVAPGEFSNTSINTSIIFTSSLKPMVLMDIKVRRKLMILLWCRQTIVLS